jgi:hypothetical protein
VTREVPYNPLDKEHLGASVTEALLKREPVALSELREFQGAGVYAIYYTGDYGPYQRLARVNRRRAFRRPIYVGKAIPKGGRKAGLGVTGEEIGPMLYRRLLEHAESIEQAENLEISDFWCRYLVVDDIWIPLGESLLIQRFFPIWNLVVDGFGNHDPGSGRYQQKRAPWDIIHPGRPWAMKCAEGQLAEEAIVAKVVNFLGETPTD